MAKIFLVVSGKGGVGKTSLSILLAKEYAQKNKRVLLIDGDMGLGCLDMMLGLSSPPNYDLSALADKRCSLDQAMVRTPEYPGVYLMQAGIEARPKDLSAKAINKVFKMLNMRFDYIFIDGPAGIGKGFKLFLPFADECILVTTPDPVCVRTAEKTLELLRKLTVNPVLVVNKVNRELNGRELEKKPQQIAFELGLDLVGALEDKAIYHHLMHPKAKTEELSAEDSEALARILIRLNGGSEDFPDYLPLDIPWYGKLKLWIRRKKH